MFEKMELKLTKTFLLDTWQFFRAHFAQIILIIFPFAIPLEVFSFFYNEGLSGEEGALAYYVPMIVYVLLYPIFGAALVFFVASIINGRPLTPAQAWGLGVKHWPSYLLLTVILMLVVGFGFAMFIAPGLFFAAKLAFAEFELLLKNEDVGKSLQSSWKSTGEYFWVLMNGGLIITLFIYGPYFAISWVLNESGLHSEAFGLVLSIIESALMALYTIYAFRVYDFSGRYTPPGAGSSAG